MQGPDAVRMTLYRPRTDADLTPGPYSANWAARAEESSRDCQEAQRDSEEREAAVRKVQREVSLVSLVGTRLRPLDSVSLHLGYTFTSFPSYVSDV